MGGGKAQLILPALFSNMFAYLMEHRHYSSIFSILKNFVRPSFEALTGYAIVKDYLYKNF